MFPIPPSPSVVLIEDDYDIRQSLEDLLVLEGYSVRAFRDGAEALSEFEQGLKAKVILLDLMMPVLNGWQFLEERARRGGELGKTPVVVLSAAMVPGLVRVESEQVKAVLPKPIDVNNLLALLERVCENRSIAA